MADDQKERITQLLAECATLRAERDEVRMRAVVAEQHKVLSLLGRSSYAEVVEDKLRTQLAETELRAEAAEAQLASLGRETRALQAELAIYKPKVSIDTGGTCSSITSTEASKR